MKTYVDAEKLQEYTTKLVAKLKTIFPGAPLVASTAAAMTNTSKIYVYTGEETGYTAGNWYYYDTEDDEWKSGGIYQSSGVECDDTLTESGVPADAAAVGAAITAAKAAVLAEIAPGYSDSETYEVGEYVIQNLGLYRCIVPITTGEVWTVAHWTQVDLAADVSDLKTQLNTNLIDKTVDHSPLNWWHDFTAGYISADGQLYADSGFVVGDYIPVNAGDVLYSKYGKTTIIAGYMTYLAAYDSSKAIIPASGYNNANNSSYTIPSGVSFVRISTKWPNRNYFIVQKNTAITEYSDYFEPYTEYLEDFITDETKQTIENNKSDVAVIKEYISDVANPVKTLDYGKLSDYGIGMPVLSRGYLSFSDGSVVANDTDSSTHMYTGFIPVSSGDEVTAKTFLISSNDVEYNFGSISFRSVIAYDENEDPIESASAVPASSVASYIVPDGVAFLRVSLYKMHDKNDKSIARVYVTSQESSEQKPRLIPNYSDTQTVRCGILTNKTAMLKPNNVIHDSTWTVCGKIGTGFTSVRIGDASYNSSTVKWESSYPYIEVYQDNGTWKIDICGYDNPALAANYNKTYSLGFVPSENICVVMEIGRTLKIEKLRVLSGMNQWSLEDESDYGNVIFNEMWNALCVTVTGTLEDVSLSQSIEQIHSKVWVFGDSWLSVYDHRVGGQLNALGADGWLKSSIHGLNSAKAITAVRTLVEMATPQTIVWAIGMNDSDSDASTVNASWKDAVEELMDICSKNGIELILYTVPSVPASQGTTTDSPRPMWAKNAYIRASGYRYIDAEKAVGADNVNGYWYDGYWKSDTDHTHTSTDGAIAVAMQYCADCPEIMYLN